MWVPVNGDSMGSTIIGGGRVRISDPGRGPRRGEIWAFASSTGDLVVHRFRSRDATRCWFRGDGNGYDDVPVLADAVIGRVAEIDDRTGRRTVGRWDHVVARLKLDVLSLARLIRR